MPYKRFFYGKIIIFLFFCVYCPACFAQTLPFAIKSAPENISVTLNDNRVVTFTAPGYRGIQIPWDYLPVKNGLLEIKLEPSETRLDYLAEYRTGIQPKSVYFSPDGSRIFVPLLGQGGIDVFVRDIRPGHPELLVFEKRLSAPGGLSAGNVEALADARRRELWVSNMEENKVHIYDLDTLEYKTGFSTGGIFPKVIVQNPEGNITVVSNWISRNISVFDSDSRELLRRIPVGGTPRGMAFSPDGNFLYVANFDEALIEVIDMTLNRVTRTFRLYEGEGACRHVIYHDNKLFVSDMYRGTVNILNASTGALLVSRRIGPNINTIVLSPDGKWVFASSRGRNNPEDYTIPGPDFGGVFMLDSQDLSVVQRVWGRNQPTGLAVSPDGNYLVFSDFLDANLEIYAIDPPW